VAAMIELFRLAVFGLIGLSVVYVLVSVYSASVRREKLEKEWDAKPPAGADRAARAAFIEEGMQAYRHGLRHKLILGVYVVPIVVVSVLVYLLNFN
jgi:hypothetical protein